MTIPKHTALTLLDRAKKSLLADLAHEIAGLEPILLAELESIDAGYDQETMLEISKGIVRDKLYYKLLLDETEKLSMVR